MSVKLKMGYSMDGNESRTRPRNSGKNIGHVADQKSSFLGATVSVQKANKFLEGFGLGTLALAQCPKCHAHLYESQGDKESRDSGHAWGGGCQVTQHRDPFQEDHQPWHTPG